MQTTAPKINNRQQFKSALYAGYPTAFARACGINPDPWQKDFMRSEEKRIILNCCRGAGKTTIVAILALYHILYQPKSLCLVISHGLIQSSELFQKVTTFYRDLGKLVPSETYNATTLKLANGSRIKSLAQTERIRGFHPSLIVIDEAALVDDDIYHGAVRPMLSVSQGRIIVLSTPHGQRGFFFNAWDDFENKGNLGNWHGIKVTAEQCSRHSPQYLAGERRDLGERYFAQEYMASFEENESNVFSKEDIDRAFHPGIFVRDDINMEDDS